MVAPESAVMNKTAAAVRNLKIEGGTMGIFAPYASQRKKMVCRRTESAGELV